jgi:hypothetical protein
MKEWQDGSSLLHNMLGGIWDIADGAVVQKCRNPLCRYTCSWSILELGLSDILCIHQVLVLSRVWIGIRQTSDLEGIHGTWLGMQ